MREKYRFIYNRKSYYRIPEFSNTSVSRMLVPVNFCCRKERPTLGSTLLSLKSEITRNSMLNY